MASLTPISAALDRATPGFNRLVDSIQNEARRIQDNRRFLKELEAQKELAVFRSDLEFEAQRKYVREVYPEKLDTDMRAAIEQAKVGHELNKEIQSQQFDQQVGLTFLQHDLQSDLLAQELEAKEAESGLKPETIRLMEKDAQDYFGQNFGAQLTDSRFRSKLSTPVARVGQDGDTMISFLQKVVDPETGQERQEHRVVRREHAIQLFDQERDRYHAVSKIYDLLDRSDVPEVGGDVDATSGSEWYMSKNILRQQLERLESNNPNEVAQALSLVQSRTFRPAVPITETERTMRENLPVNVSRMFTVFEDPDVFTEEDRFKGVTFSDLSGKIRSLRDEADSGGLTGRANEFEEYRQYIRNVMDGIRIVKDSSMADVSSLYINPNWRRGDPASQLAITESQFKQMFSERKANIVDIDNFVKQVLRTGAFSTEAEARDFYKRRLK